MIEFLSGIALGAVFSKFWLMIWDMISIRIKAMMPPKKEDK